MIIKRTLLTINLRSLFFVLATLAFLTSGVMFFHSSGGFLSRGRDDKQGGSCSSSPFVYF